MSQKYEKKLYVQKKMHEKRRNPHELRRFYDIKLNEYLFLYYHLLHLVYDSLESLRVVHGEVGKHLAVDFDASLGQCTHQLRIADTLDASCSVDTLNPKSTELTLLATTVGKCVCEAFLVGVFGNGPNVLASTELTFNALQNLLAASA